LSRCVKELQGVQVCASFPAALAEALKRRRPVFVIGGREIYRQALPIAEELYISWIKGDHAGDNYFPPLELDDWQCLAEEDFPGFRYAHYRRKQACTFLDV
jgi:dihydrofolate reductase